MPLLTIVDPKKKSFLSPNGSRGCRLALFCHQKHCSHYTHVVQTFVGYVEKGLLSLGLQSTFRLLVKLTLDSTMSNSLRGQILAISGPTCGISEASRVDIDILHLQYCVVFHN
jgi:hypothetical protein